MLLYTNENNTSALKLIIASTYGNKPMEIVETSLSDSNLPPPRQLPFLEVNEDLKFFSSNAALLYLVPPDDHTAALAVKEILEWEATTLLPIVVSVLSSKTVGPVTKQSLVAYLNDLEKKLSTKQYLNENKLSAADVSVWCSLYALITQATFKEYISGLDKLTAWFKCIQELDFVKVSVELWLKGTGEGANKGTAILSASRLALPHTTRCTDQGSPDESAVSGPSADEIRLAEDRWRNGRNLLPKLPPKQKIVLPQKNFKNVLITSALPYVNNVPHLGNIIGCVLSADIFARYCRMCGYNTLYICGTDEYGTATETKALEEGLTPKEICDKYFEIHNAVYRWFGIGFDYFGRTTTLEQTQIAQKMFLTLKDNGFLLTESVEQLLCKKCDRFLADRFVEGTCPLPGCGYEDARGDQCDKCGKLVNATELIKPRCKVCSSTPQITHSTQFFLDLPQLEGPVRTWFQACKDDWSGSAKAVTNSWLRDGLKPRCITRDLKWGVPVPLPEFSSKVFYVWFDAPIGYLSITQKYTSDYEQWWKPKADHKVKLYQFMAKDNVPFHGIMFPATLIGVNEKHILVNHIMATEYLNYEDGKFSKSRGVGVFGTDAQETGIKADVWRFYLASIRPEGQDSSFSWTELVTRNNSELLNNLGNFCHRGLSFCSSSFKGIVPEALLTDTELELIALVNRELKSYVRGMEVAKFRDALKHTLTVSRLGNQYMQSEQPWVLLKGSDNDKLRAATAIALCCNLSALLATLLTPFMPETSRRLFQQLATTEEHCRINPEHPEMRVLLPAGHRIGKPEPLFEKLDQKSIDELKMKYAGTQTERAQREGSAGTAPEKTDLPLTASQLEEAVAKQGDKVRALKQSGAEKSVVQSEVAVLLALKKKLSSAPKDVPVAVNNSNPVGDGNAVDVKQLEDEVAKQGEKVRTLKSSGAEKAVWQPEVTKLLDLKKKLSLAGGEAATPPKSGKQKKK